jgi:hypothetical protein
MILRNRLGWTAALVLLLSVSGCGTRSISDSGYYAGGYGGDGGNRLYRGELAEFDVLGIDHGQAITEGEIQKSLDDREPLSIRRGASIMLIQSGAMFPDEPMVKALQSHFVVGQFSGIPQDRDQQASTTPAAPASYAMALRLAAARGGYEKIVAYWGVLETAQQGLGTKVISWVPIVGNIIPDESQRMRIRLKVAVIDVKSGQWEMFTPAPIEDDAVSARLTRESSDQAQVALLKEAGYKAAAAWIAARHSL